MLQHFLSRFVLHYLNKDIINKEIIVAIQDDKLIFLNENERLVNKPILITDIWKDIKTISCALMYKTKKSYKFHLFSDESYYSIDYPYFGTYDKKLKKYIPIELPNKRSLEKSIIWNVNMGSECYRFDTIFPIYNPSVKDDTIYYIFQNNRYVRYNLETNKVDVVV